MAYYPTVFTLVILIMHVFAATLALERGERLDMSYPFGDTTLYWPGAGSFEQFIQVRGPSGNISWYEANTFSAPEHGGTHIDAPSHFSEGKLRVDDIPVDRFEGPAIRVDISEQGKADEDYLMTAKDLQDWEEVYGKIPDGALLFVYTGWGKFYPDRLAYFGSPRNDTYLDDQGESVLHFPGVAPEASTWLVDNRKISGLGIDTPSVDYGQSTTFRTHEILFAANIYALENVANLDKLPNTGAKVYALPMYIADGSGAPVRIVAMLDEESTCGAATHSAAYVMLGSCLGLSFLAAFS